MRWAGQPHPCITPANDLFALWANRRGNARIRRPKGQESLYGHRPWQVAARGSVPLRRLAQRRGYCTPLRFSRGHNDRATVLRFASAIARTTCPLQSALLRASPPRRARRTPCHCAANLAHLRRPMVFWDTCLQTLCPCRDTILRARGLFDGSVPENHEEFYLSLRSRANARSRPPDNFYSVRKDRRAATNRRRAHRPGRRTRRSDMVCRLCCVLRAPRPL